ncbi:MAG: carbon-nitrogen hydrolase family protein [Gammaproteobacteria bacterium]|nr:carbon-nitrogen hydrolase family protein [Gammaproteobacteria bacterium]
MAEVTPIGIIQLCATSDVAKNLETTTELSRRAAQEGARVVFLPEAFCYIGSERGRLQILESLDEEGPILRACKEIARDNNVHVVAGGFPEKAPDGSSYNTCFHLEPNGNLQAVYHKIHLFDVDLPDGTRMLESRGTSPGEHLRTTELPFGTLGLTVCYDIRFPRLYQDLVDLGATAITIPAAFTRTTGRDHWHVLLQARAIECQAYVIAPAQYGSHQHRTRHSFGHAMVVDPWGKILVECSTDSDDFAVVNIDPAEVTRVRSELPSLDNRRSWQ